MKILHVEAGQYLYGGARQVAYIVKGLSEQGVKNIVACPTGAAIEEEVAQSAVVCPMTMNGDHDVGMVGRLCRVMRDHQPDLVHLHSRRGADLWGGMAAHVVGLPCVLSRRVDNTEAMLWAMLKYRLYDHVIAISEAIRLVLLSCGVPGEKVSCVRSAVDPAPYAHPVDHDQMRQTFDLPQDALIVGMVAQLIPRKGHRYLIDAVDMLRHDFPSLRVLCFGQGAAQGDLEKMVRARHLTDIIRFVGFRADLPQWLGGLDILAHPADKEGLGVSLLQAAAAKVPIVTTRAGGLPEAVLDGSTGLLIDPGDTVGLAEALARLLSHPELRAEMGAAGRARILKEFSIAGMVRGNLDVYEKVLAGKK